MSDANEKSTKPISLRIDKNDLQIIDAVTNGERGRSAKVNALLESAIKTGLGFKPKISVYKALDKKTVLVSLQPKLVKSMEDIADSFNLKVNFLITLIIHNYANSQKGNV